MNQKHLLRYIKSKVKKAPETIVKQKGDNALTLADVFKELNLTPYDLSIDHLDMHADVHTFQVSNGAELIVFVFLLVFQLYPFLGDFVRACMLGLEIANSACLFQMFSAIRSIQSQVQPMRGHVASRDVPQNGQSDQGEIFCRSCTTSIPRP
jgi:hypothetical protein